MLNSVLIFEEPLQQCFWFTCPHPRPNVAATEPITLEPWCAPLAEDLCGDAEPPPPSFTFRCDEWVAPIYSFEMPDGNCDDVQILTLVLYQGDGIYATNSYPVSLKSF